MAMVAEAVGAGNTMSIGVSDTTYGKSLDDAFTEINDESKQFEVAEKVSYPLSTTDLSAIAARIVRPSPDIVYNEGYPTDGLNLGRLFADKVDTSAKVFLSTATEAVVLKELGDKANGMILSAPASAKMKGIPASFAEFQSAYTKAVPDVPFNSSAISGYSAMRFISAAIEKAGCAEPAAVATALHDVVLDHDNGNVYPQPELAFNEDGSLKDPPVSFDQIQDGKPVNIYPKETAEGPPIPYR
jgi:branched-chain amino acid transport system substrate-binding protein